MGDLRIQQLFIYPLKSAAGMRVASATIDSLGFVGDRRWMAVDDEGRFLSQRRLTRMALLRATSLPGEHLFLDAPGTSLYVERPAHDGPTRQVTVWQDTVTALDAGDAAARWLTSALDHKARLVYCPPSRGRVVDRSYASGEERVGFADGFPLLVLGDSSLSHINASLREAGQAPVTVERFRPNVVIEGGAPFAEDTWNELRVCGAGGAIRIDLVKPCARCSIISVDPATGIQGAEPMRTLTSYRRRQNDVFVGQNALPRDQGTITTGDAVTVS